MRVFVDSLGCRLNEAEAEAWTDSLRARGHERVVDLADADAAVLNSCAVTHEATVNSRSRARELARAARIVAVSGCWATLTPDDAALAAHVIVVPNADKLHTIERLERAAAEHGISPALPTQPPAAEARHLAAYDRRPPEDSDARAPTHPSAFPGQSGDVSASSAAASAHAPSEHGLTRAFLKVGDGCRNRCTFCITTLARGEEVSRPLADIVTDARARQAAGAREVVLTAVHLAGWGHDLGLHLGALLEALLAQTTIERIRLGSTEPWDLPESLWQRWRDPRLMPHVHLPAQAGSDAVLRRMARRARRAEMITLFERIRREIPAATITTDLIAGFPGESDEEFAETVDFVQRAAFDGAHVFPFSPREGTRAARLPNPVPTAVRRTRARHLRELVERQRLARLQAHVGHEQDILWEKPELLADGRWRARGFSANYLPCEHLGLAAATLRNQRTRSTPVAVREGTLVIDHLGSFVTAQSAARSDKRYLPVLAVS